MPINNLGVWWKNLVFESQGKAREYPLTPIQGVDEKLEAYIFEIIIRIHENRRKVSLQRGDPNKQVIDHCENQVYKSKGIAI